MSNRVDGLSLGVGGRCWSLGQEEPMEQLHDGHRTELSTSTESEAHTGGQMVSKGSESSTCALQKWHESRRHRPPTRAIYRPSQPASLLSTYNGKHHQYTTSAPEQPSSEDNMASNCVTLMTLPTELRLEIYDRTMALFNFNHPRYSVPEHPLLQTSKQVRDEAMASYNKRLTIIVKSHTMEFLIATLELLAAIVVSGPGSAEVLTAKEESAKMLHRARLNDWLMKKKRRQLKEVGYELQN
ncbi:hypothetical protein DOTSEDRAFT_18927 [Dothistroma septosporum NZE10]|uniref:Uncharacterized protein n=1 Tax=Dothistroma septosporum (strain NZE10 / CBS 128990) TaxID=675120 RepID=N1PXY8_DOTSN|nr:hypothetical protein DOTSEDRAFT_18927 [Dothistroma septosporum NZE10]